MSICQLIYSYGTQVCCFCSNLKTGLLPVSTHYLLYDKLSPNWYYDIYKPLLSFIYCALNYLTQQNTFSALSGIL